MDYKLVKITSFWTSVEARLAMASLKAEGVESFLEGEETVAGINFLANAVGGVKLFVREADVDRAIGILSPATEGAARNEWTCERCGEVVSGGFSVCWSCGTSVDGTVDPQFESVDPGMRETDVAPSDVSYAPNAASPGDHGDATDRFGDGDSTWNCPDCDARNPSRMRVCSMCGTSVDGDVNPYFARPIEDSDPAAPVELTESETAEGDAVAQRAFRAAALGFAWCPIVMQAYSMSLLLLLRTSGLPLSDRGQRQYNLAMMLDVITLVVVVLIVLLGGLL
jgi:hypothetical protein